MKPIVFIFGLFMLIGCRSSKQLSRAEQLTAVSACSLRIDTFNYDAISVVDVVITYDTLSRIVSVKRSCSDALLSVHKSEIRSDTSRVYHDIKRDVSPIRANDTYKWIYFTIIVTLVLICLRKLNT